MAQGCGTAGITPSTGNPRAAASPWGVPPSAGILPTSGTDPCPGPLPSTTLRALALFLGMLAPALLLAACGEDTVNVLEVAEVSLSPAELSVVQGSSEALTATPRDAAGRPLSGRTVEWSSGDPSIAEVSSAGVVEGRAPGSTLVRAAADGVEGTADVTVLPGPSIQLSTTSVQWQAFSGQGDVVQEEIQLSNGGEGTLGGLQVSVEDADGPDPAWLEATLRSSTAPTVLELRGSAAELEPGDYTATATVSSPAAVDGAVAVHLQFEVQVPPAVIALDPTSWSPNAPERSLTPATQTVSVRNDGGGELDQLTVRIEYTGGGATGWLSAELDSGTAPTEMEVEASARQLDPGEYTARVLVSSPAADEPGELSVTFTVQARGQVELP